MRIIILPGDSRVATLEVPDTNYALSLLTIILTAIWAAHQRLPPFDQTLIKKPRLYVYRRNHGNPKFFIRRSQNILHKRCPRIAILLIPPNKISRSIVVCYQDGKVNTLNSVNCRNDFKSQPPNVSTPVLRFYKHVDDCGNGSRERWRINFV